ncbi:MAG TPA: undecaprenyl-diphosphatase UppP [Bryobacteraceae bacterium]|jgi:undecaprenyl-diphosphatase|nr:undecaprenyl-diphosphatase UppP [Bryobacteraceae bacterium]
MPLYQVIVLAIIQALTEFAPVSSSAHLEVAPWLFGWKDPGLTFDVALHAGTLAAILIYFFKDWVQIIGQGLGLRAGTDPQLKQNRALLWLLAIASIPIGVIGFLFNKQAETSWRNPYLIGAMLIVIGIVMWIAERRGAGTKPMSQINWADGLTIGIAQALAVVPGTSRSGITITAGMFRGLDRETSARFSFLLSAPAIAAAALKKGWDIHKHGGIPPDMKIPFLVGTALSAILGAIVIAFFLRYLRRHSLMLFVYYRIVFGIIVIALAAFFRFTAE